MERRDGVCARAKPLPPRYLPLWASEKDDPAFSHALGCVKDAWGLMDRPAASIYFSKAALERAMFTEAPAQNFSCLPQANWYHECGLGCALHLQGVRVRVISKLVRDGSGGLQVRMVRFYNEGQDRVEPPAATSVIQLWN